MTLSELLSQAMPRDEMGEKIGQYHSLFYTLISMSTGHFNQVGKVHNLCIAIAATRRHTSSFDMAIFARESIRRNFTG